MAGDVYCSKCGYWRGHPNQPNGKFICSKCKIGYDSSIEIAEQRLGA